ncbi:MAG: RnfABCDGE type electron transport complex subunit D [Clostridiales bacterium]|nr:RnfABCDGE type electron transport complex subunit D [Clostridiales bacterium]
MSLKHMAPFIHTPMNDSYMQMVRLISLIPVMSIAVIFYGLRAALLILFCAGVFAISDDICTRLRENRHDSYLSSLFYGCAFALLLPPDTPLYIALLGSLFGSVVIRQLAGGRGSALIHPSCAARLFVRIVFPANEAALAIPGKDRFALESLIFGSDGMSYVNLHEYYPAEILMGRYPSFLGTACALMMVVGLVYLIAKRVYKFYIPVAYISMLSVLLLIGNVYLEGSSIQMFIGTTGVMFTAAYLLCDDETIKQFGPIAIVQAFICAALTFLLSFKTSGVDLIVVPVIFTGLLTGIFEYADKVLRTTWEERLHAKP